MAHFDRVRFIHRSEAVALLSRPGVVQVARLVAFSGYSGLAAVFSGVFTVPRPGVFSWRFLGSVIGVRFVVGAKGLVHIVVHICLVMIGRAEHQ